MRWDLQQVSAHSRTGVHSLAQLPVTSRLDKGTKGCYRCGGSHDPSQCHFRDAACHACVKKDHKKLTCRSQTKVPRGTVGEQVQRQPVHQTEVDTVTALQEYILYPLQATATRLLKTTVKVEDQDLIMEVDTGASVTILSEATQGRTWLAQLAPPLHLTDVKLRTYGT